MTDDEVRERAKKRMAEMGIPVGSDDPTLQALGAPPLERAGDDVTGGAQAECGFCTRGRWHNPRTNQRELCPYCDGSGYVARAGLRRHADRLCAVCMAEEALNG